MNLSDGTEEIVSPFDIENMILSLLSDELLMKGKNLALGYDILTGDVDDNHPHNHKYGEVHIEDAWKEASDHYCVTEGKHMPISLISIFIYWILFIGLLR